MSEYRIEFELEGLPKSQTNNYGHWTTRHRSKSTWEKRVAQITMGRTPKEPLPVARIKLTRHSSSEPDFDNLVASFKPVMDGLVKSGIIKDDKPSVIGQPEYFWKKAAPKAGKVSVVVWGKR